MVGVGEKIGDRILYYLIGEMMDFGIFGKLYGRNIKVYHMLKVNFVRACLKYIFLLSETRKEIEPVGAQKRFCSFF